jgi:hypothetical protein
VQLLTQYDGNVVKVYRALAAAGAPVRYSTLTAFCRSNHLLAHVSGARRSADRVREWLLDLINGKQPMEYLQVEAPNSDVQFLFFQLKHGRSRQRKKAATILARKRGIPNSVIAKAIHSSCSTTRRYYRMYNQAGLETLFKWNTNRRFGNQCNVSERTKRILELLHHKPTSFSTSGTQTTDFLAYLGFERKQCAFVARRECYAKWVER